MTNDQFTEIYYPKYKNVIEAISRKLARADEDLYDDLVSAGTIGLLHADPSKAGKNEDAYLRQIIRNKAVDFLRFLNRRDFDRLDSYLNSGHDVVRDPVTGDPMFVHGDNETRPVHPRDSTPPYTTKRQRLAACREFDAVGDDE